MNNDGVSSIPIPSADLLLAVARQAALLAGGHALNNPDRRRDANRVDRHDVKHALDDECEQIATGAIRSVFPDHAILGEETASGNEVPPPGVRWVVDPIDGTVNFFHGLPIWCCSVAAQVAGETVAGVVFAPELELCFTGVRGGRAFCNGMPLRVSDTGVLQQAVVATGADRSEDPSQAFRFLAAIGREVQRPRILGSAALDLCFVASGRVDGYFEQGIFLWDVAAAGLIVQCAGGSCEILREHGGHRMAFLASNGRIQQPLRDLLLPLF
jgi:myo-inositol-1(or 4)-monophosphatase